LTFETTDINDNDTNTAVDASVSDTNEMLLLDTDNSNLSKDDLTDMSKVANALNAQINLTSNSGDDALIVIEASDSEGTFGVYVYTENGTNINQFDAEELIPLAVVNGDDVAASDFITA